MASLSPLSTLVHPKYLLRVAIRSPVPISSIFLQPFTSGSLSYTSGISQYPSVQQREATYLAHRNESSADSRKKRYRASGQGLGSQEEERTGRRGLKSAREQTNVFHLTLQRNAKPKTIWNWSSTDTMAVPRDARQNYHLQYVSTPTADTPGTMMVLHFDNKRYMFGRMAEGTQRACVQRGVSVKKVRNIFLTGTNTWKDNGGLIGFMITLADQQKQEIEDNGTGERPRLNIHGGPKLLHTIACARRFVFRTGVPLAIHESTGEPFTWPCEPSLVDENIRVWPIAIAGNLSTVNGQLDHSKATADQQTRQQIVSDMFDSEWRKDRLVETPFKEVKMPAMVWLRDSTTKEFRGKQCFNMDDAPEIKQDQTVLVRNPWPSSLIGELPEASNLPSGMSMSYIIRGHQQRGSFDSAKAKELGVPNGPIRKDLTMGESIMLQDGRVITPDMVLGESKEGRGIAFFDLPTMKHLENLQTLVKENPSMLENVALANWILGPGLGSSSHFDHMVRSQPNIQHVSSNPDVSANMLAFDSAAGSSVRLSEVSSILFPPPEYDNNHAYDRIATTEDYNNIEPMTDLPVAKLDNGSSPAQIGMKINIEPKYSIDKSEIPEAATLESIPKAVSEHYLSAKSALGLSPITTTSTLDEPEIITLGTGSALPSKYRNVSSTLLRMPGVQGNYLLDCGENTSGQLRRIYPFAQYQSLLLNLKAIWISHLHADHHLGTVSLLQERAEAFNALAPDADRTIYVISEQNKLDFLREYSSVEPSLVRSTGLTPIVAVPEIGTTLDGNPFTFPSHTPIAKLQTCRVSHCWGAQAISITFTSGFKVSYSGDCRPSNRFCRIGHDSDVLIHEATFDDGMEGDAIAKKHSTTSEALGVAMEMRAKNVLLTHFSQRYQKVPNLDNIKLPQKVKYEDEQSGEEEQGPIDAGEAITEHEASQDRQAELLMDHDFPTSTSTSDPAYGDPAASDRDKALLASVSASQAVRQASRERHKFQVANRMAICVAFDYMRVRVSQIKECKKLYPAIQAMFDEMEARSEERRRIERERMEEAMRVKREGKGPQKQNQQQKRAKQTQKENGTPKKGRPQMEEGTVEANGELTGPLD